MACGYHRKSRDFDIFDGTTAHLHLSLRFSCLQGASLACGTITYLYLARDRVHLDTETGSHKLEQGAGRGLISMSEVEKHNKAGDLWVVIEGKVWDMTEVSVQLTLTLGIGSSLRRC
jgi:hypothetical protein